LGKKDAEATLKSVIGDIYKADETVTRLSIRQRRQLANHLLDHARIAACGELIQTGIWRSLSAPCTEPCERRRLGMRFRDIDDKCIRGACEDGAPIRFVTADGGVYETFSLFLIAVDF